MPTEENYKNLENNAVHVQHGIRCGIFIMKHWRIAYRIYALRIV